MKNDHSPERRVVQLLQEIILETADEVSRYADAKDEPRKLRRRRGKLFYWKDARDEREFLAERFNYYQSRIEDEDEGETSYLVQKLIDTTIELSESLETNFPPKSRPDRYLMRTETGEVTANFIDLHSASTRLKFDELNLCVRKIEARHLQQAEVDLDSIPTETTPIEWDGTDADLVDLYFTLREKHYVRFKSNYAGFNQIIQHFVGKEGKCFKRDNLTKGLKQRKRSGNRPFESIPYNSQAS
jgi:hypothetical protein